MDQAQLLSIIGSMYDKFVADVSAKVESSLKDSIKTNFWALVDDAIQAKINDLTGLDKAFIAEIAKGEISDALGDLDDAISEWMSNNFDISDYEDNLNIEDKVSDCLSDRLSDRVRDEVRDLTFSVIVE